MNFKQLDKILNESGIRIPKGTHAAKIIHHQDFDGVFSAIIAYNQLVKQGLNPKHITTQWIQYGDTQQGYIDKLNKSKGQMTVLVDFARIPEGTKKPDFWSDHHASDNTKGAGGGRIGATEFKSDSDHLSLLHTINMVDQKTIDVVNKIDSAGYTNLEDVLTLRKDFKEKGRLERLGIIAYSLLSRSKILNDNSLLEQFIKKTKPNIISFYTNIVEYTMLNDVQEEAIRELRKEHPDWDMIERARRAMPNQKSKNRIQKGSSFNESKIDDYEEYKKLKSKKNKTKEEKDRFLQLKNQSAEDIRKDRRDEIAKQRGSDTDFEKRGSTLIQHNGRLQRYIWSQMNTKGFKYPFIIKRYPTFIQIATNPELPDEVKEKIDLGIISDEVMKNIRSKFENKYNKWAFDIIDSEKGGHKGITNIPALGTIGIMKKADREELKYLKSIEDRIKKLSIDKRRMSDEEKEQLEKAAEMLKNKEITEIDYDKLEDHLKSSMRIVVPAKYKRFAELKDRKKWFAKKRTEIMDEIIEEFIDQFEKKFGASKDIPVIGKNKDISIQTGKKEYEFESVIHRLKNEILEDN